MSLHPAPGEGSVPSYQVSSRPYLTSSQISLGNIQKYSFPYVTRFFVLQNRSATATDKIAFAVTENGLKTGTANYITLDAGESFSGDLRVNILFVSGVAGNNVNYQLAAGLTNIPHQNFFTLTGSAGIQGVG